MATYIVVEYCNQCKKYFNGVLVKPKDCSICGNKTNFKCVDKHNTVFENDNKPVFCNVDGMMKENIRVSRSLGVSAVQIDEARKAHPGVEWVKRDSSYCPVIHNRTEKLRILKQAKMEEYG